MPRPNRVDPIRLGGMPVEPLMNDPPEQPDEERPSINWQRIFEIGAFQADEMQFLLLHRLAGIPWRAVGDRLGWEPKRVNAVHVRADRKLRKLKAALLAFSDFTGGSSRKLSFARRLDSGEELWNLRHLDREFDRVLSVERRYVTEKISIKERTKP